MGTGGVGSINRVFGAQHEELAGWEVANAECRGDEQYELEAASNWKWSIWDSTS